MFIDYAHVECVLLFWFTCNNHKTIHGYYVAGNDTVLCLSIIREPEEVICPPPPPSTFHLKAEQNDKVKCSLINYRVIPPATLPGWLHGAWPGQFTEISTCSFNTIIPPYWHHDTRILAKHVHVTSLAYETNKRTERNTLLVWESVHFTFTSVQCEPCAACKVWGNPCFYIICPSGSNTIYVRVEDHKNFLYIFMNAV